MEFLLVVLSIDTLLGIFACDTSVRQNAPMEARVMFIFAAVNAVAMAITISLL